MMKTHLTQAIVRGISALVPLHLFGCGAAYVVRSAGFQARLLTSGEPVAQVLETGGLSAGQEQRLRLVADIKAYGRALGLRATRNYDRYARRWDHRIWNVSACEPFSLSPKTWWFPIVGTVPYLGYFTAEDVARSRAALVADGYEVAVREVGAYSTLGWFADPVLPSMLRWDEARLAETVLHELAHATLWVSGSVSFNESFARIVGETAADGYLVSKYGESSAEVTSVRTADGDWLVVRAVLSELHDELDRLYHDDSVDSEARAAKKATLYASLEARVAASAVADPARWRAYVRSNEWNNPRLSQFRTYNSGDAEFAALLAAEDGDLLGFIQRVRHLTRGQSDPFAALRRAVPPRTTGP
ncbi:MAG: hypothetical protein EXR71_02135 [Myxococcales bacterium]|nr:hypothetical protein [Myxococcales bacterium]